MQICFLQIQHLTHVVGRFGEQIHHDAFLQSMRLEYATNYNEGDLPSPQLLLWLESDARSRRADLINWLKCLHTLYDTVSVYLNLLRSTAEFDMIDTCNGFYQRSLPSKTNCHLILLRMDKHAGIVPKMQLGHHGLSLRLCEATSMNDIRHTDAKIGLAICQL